MPRPKLQHYVPRLILRRFVGDDPDGMVWTYDKQRPDAPRPSLPEETGGESNLYTVFDDNDEPNDAMEEFLSKIEGEAAGPYALLLEGKISTGQERVNFAQFVALQFARAPGLRRMYGQMLGFHVQAMADVLTDSKERFAASIGRWRAEKGIAEPIDIDEMYEFVRDKSKYTIAVNREATIQALGISDRLVNIFHDMSWTIFSTDTSRPFITNDAPVVRVARPDTIHPFYGDGGFLNRTVEVTVPLSPTRLIHMAWGRHDSKSIYPAPPEVVKTFNRVRATNADRFLYADRRDEGIRRLCEKYKNIQPGITINGSANFDRISVKRNFRKSKR